MLKQVRDIFLFELFGFRMQNEHRGARPQLVERLNLPVQPPGLPQARVFQESIVQGNEEVETLSFYDNYGYGDGKTALRSRLICY